MTLDLAKYDAMLKQRYTESLVRNMAYQDKPLFALIPKMRDFTGKNHVMPIKITPPQGRSATFATAQANKVGSSYEDFVLTRVRDYAVASIQGETILASAGSSAAFLDAVTSELDGAIEALSRSLAWSLYGDGSGVIGQIASVVGTVVALSSAEDIVHFELGQKLVSNVSTTGAGTARVFATGVSAATVTKVDRDAGTLEVAAIGAGSTLAAGDFLFVEGDRGLKMSGLAAWCPMTAPGATPFFGVDRSIDASRLGGIRVPQVNVPIEEALITGARRIAREGGRPDHAFLSFEQWANLEKSLGSKVQYADVTAANSSIGFKAISVQGPKGNIKVIADQDAPNDRIYLLQLDTWKLCSIGEPTRLLDIDSNKMLREASADAYEVRAAFYGNVGNCAPGYNGVIKLK